MTLSTGRRKSVQKCHEFRTLLDFTAFKFNTKWHGNIKGFGYRNCDISCKTRDMTLNVEKYI